MTLNGFNEEGYVPNTDVTAAELRFAEGGPIGRPSRERITPAGRDIAVLTVMARLDAAESRLKSAEGRLAATESRLLAIEIGTPAHAAEGTRVVGWATVSSDETGHCEPAKS